MGGRNLSALLLSSLAPPPAGEGPSASGFHPGDCCLRVMSRLHQSGPEPPPGMLDAILWLVSGTVMQAAAAHAIPVLPVVPTAPGAPGAPGDVILLRGIRISRFVIGARAVGVEGVRVGASVLRHSRPRQHGRKNRASSQQCKLGHTFLHSVTARRTRTAKPSSDFVARLDTNSCHDCVTLRARMRSGVA